MMRRLAVLALSAFAAGCINIDLPSATLVDTPRILAMVAQPPEAAPGEDVWFAALLVNGDGSPLVHGVNGVEIEWTICVGLGSLLDESGFFTAPGDESCVDFTGQPTDPLVLEGVDDLPEGFVQLDGAVTGQLGQQLEAILAVGQDPELSALIEGVLLVGIPLEVEIRVSVPQPDGETFVMRGFKRVGLTTRDDRTTNPPPPRFRVGERWYSGRDLDTPFRCVPEAEAASVAAGEDVALRPDEDDDFWIETYPVFNLNGDVQINDESSFYSFFSTAGEFDEEITQRPFRDAGWTAPEEPGRTPHWIVVRDGHLGTSACGFDVDVTE